MKYKYNPTLVIDREFFINRQVFLSLVSLGVIAFSFFANPLSLQAAPARAVSSDFRYTFNSPGVLLESGSMDTSSSPYFWVNSGAKFIMKDGVGQTVKENLSATDPMRVLYAKTNPLDTDDGYRPQNIFRFLTRSKWGSAEQEVTFRITAQNLSDSPNRAGHNGVLLMSRYKDSNNLYYAGVRNDGVVTIKKKIAGKYHTLASVQIFGVKGKYNRDTTPSLLPLNKWTGMKLETINQSNGSVRLRVLLDRENTGKFTSILSVDDYGTGGAPHRDEAYSGIRTDFMDVEFKKYNIKAF